MDQYKPEKAIWTDNDFSIMGWHDCPIRSLAFSPDTFELLLDIDYIFQWIHPEGDNTHFSFWIAPVTMVFENVRKLRFDIAKNMDLDISDISRSNRRLSPNGKLTVWDYSIEFLEGFLNFSSTGYQMIVRQAPSLEQGQILEMDKRGGLGFGRETYI